MSIRRYVPSFRFICRVLLLLVVLYGVGVLATLASIQLRLWRNGAIAEQLVKRLDTTFPVAKFRGGAGYNREVVYIAVTDGADKVDGKEVEDWLREKKNTEKIAPQIVLSLTGSFDPQSILIDP